MALEFFVPCVPPTTSHHRKNIVRIGEFVTLADAKTLVAAKKTLDALMRPYRPSAPLRGSVSLTLEYTWPWRTSDPVRVRARGRIPRITRPDCSNLAKTTEDRLVANHFLEDDAQVVELTVRKFYGTSAGIRVRLAAYDSPDGLPMEIA